MLNNSSGTKDHLSNDGKVLSAYLLHVFFGAVWRPKIGPSIVGKSAATERNLVSTTISL